MLLVEGAGTTPQADGKAKLIGCIREVVDDELQGLLYVGEKGTVISKHLLSDEFLIYFHFHVCKEMPKVEQTAVWQVLFCLTEHDGEEDGEQGGGLDAPKLGAVGDREVAGLC